jgi:hypothetical protein
MVGIPRSRASGDRRGGSKLNLGVREFLGAQGAEYVRAGLDVRGDDENCLRSMPIEHPEIAAGRRTGSSCKRRRIGARCSYLRESTVAAAAAFVRRAAGIPRAAQAHADRAPSFPSRLIALMASASRASRRSTISSRKRCWSFDQAHVREPMQSVAEQLLEVSAAQPAACSANTLTPGRCSTTQSAGGGWVATGSAFSSRRAARR